MGSSCECMVVSSHNTKQNIFLANPTRYLTKQSNSNTFSSNSNLNELNKKLSFINSNNNINLNESLVPFVYKDNTFETMLLNEINQVRLSPSGYAVKLKNMLNNNVQMKNNVCVLVYNKDRIILNKGKDVFNEAICFLNNMSPVNELQLNEEIRINIANGNNVNTHSDKTEYSTSRINTNTNNNNSNNNSNNSNKRISVKTLKHILLNKKLTLLNKYPNCLFTYDIFSNPELSVVLQITDEAFNKARRNIILSPNINYFATCCFYNRKNQFTSVSSFA